MPIVSGVAGLVAGAGLRLRLERARPAASTASAAPSSAPGRSGLFVYGVLNRLLIVTGLHHILNNIAWFIIGDFHGATGDLNRFFAGDPTAGAFMTGFFPVMMFGLPAACLAMYHAARPERRAAVGGMLLSMALTAFLTGVTEPIEFTFMFLAPVLYALHAVLTGAVHGADGRAGRAAGLRLLGRPVRLCAQLRQGDAAAAAAAGRALAYFALYYGLFRFVDPPLRPEDAGPRADGDGRRRRADRAAAARPRPLSRRWAARPTWSRSTPAPRGCGWSWPTRRAVDEPALKALGARGLVRPSARDLQVVLGPIADQVAREMNAWLAGDAGVAPALRAAARRADASALLAALGGQANVREVATCSSRLRIARRRLRPCR